MSVPAFRVKMYGPPTDAERGRWLVPRAARCEMLNRYTCRGRALVRVGCLQLCETCYIGYAKTLAQIEYGDGGKIR